jgi:3-deoxy-D-manno-octulosonic-acid transferase
MPDDDSSGSRHNCAPMPLWFRLVYRLLWLIALPFALLRLWRKGGKNPGYRLHWRERLALTVPTGPFDVWIHAVSVGEARAMLPLVERLLPNSPRMLVTCTTPTGRATALTLLGDRATVTYLPFDAPWLIAKFLRAAQPKLGLLIETELWPGTCDGAQRAGVPLWLVNARLSERSAAGYAKGGALTRNMLGCLTGIAAQTQSHAGRFQALGARHVVVTGNLKFDLALSADADAPGKALAAHLVGQRAMWVAGSTREGEEALLLDALIQHPLRKRAVAVIVPRHPERWDAAFDAAKARGYRVARRSDAGVPDDTEVIIGDSMGEMLAYYGQARAVVMGGTLAGTGGQNLIEPCAMGVPVVLGPSLFNFQQAADEAIAAGAAVTVPHADADAALDAVLTWVDDASARDLAGAHARAFVTAHRGATERTMALLARFL